MQRSVCRGDFTLASGAKSDLYVDCKLTTLDPRGAVLTGQVGWALVRQTAAELGVAVDSLGGLTMGADAISLSIGMAAWLEDAGHRVQTFTVRKAAKAHGRQADGGKLCQGHSVVVMDDVITTGGSTLQAIDAIEAAGGRVAFVIALVDRQEGGREEYRGPGAPGRLDLHARRRDAERPGESRPDKLRPAGCRSTCAARLRRRRALVCAGHDPFPPRFRPLPARARRLGVLEEKARGRVAAEPPRLLRRRRRRPRRPRRGRDRAGHSPIPHQQRARRNPALGGGGACGQRTRRGLRNTTWT